MDALKTRENQIMQPKITNETATFAQWIAALNAEAKAREYVGPDLSEQTGEECWRSYYDDGSTPAEALHEDELCGL